MQHLAEPSLLAGAELNERGVQLQGPNIWYSSLRRKYTIYLALVLINCLKSSRVSTSKIYTTSALTHFFLSKLTLLFIKNLSEVENSFIPGSLTGN